MLAAGEFCLIPHRLGFRLQAVAVDFAEADLMAVHRLNKPGTVNGISGQRLPLPVQLGHVGNHGMGVNGRIEIA